MSNEQERTPLDKALAPYVGLPVSRPLMTAMGRDIVRLLDSGEAVLEPSLDEQGHVREVSIVPRPGRFHKRLMEKYRQDPEFAAAYEEAQQEITAQQREDTEEINGPTVDSRGRIVDGPSGEKPPLGPAPDFDQTPCPGCGGPMGYHDAEGFCL